MPVFDLKLYTQPKELELLNNVDNADCNQFLSALKINVRKFDYSNWGKYIKDKDDVKITFTLRNLQ